MLRYSLMQISDMLSFVDRGTSNKQTEKQDIEVPKASRKELILCN
jgi:hypothetical protein